ncbi:hypothetical protein WN51_07470 [Melipona quadrifasciata]|uniref:Uncharacterized protein n=1 Tax=Melipona quadrifasciata TaxID=166423 RepID=A0A0M9A9H8_9HYME|nr:hypothetical protein WN51_07470 [Melipona quadrifasciata]
MEEQMKEFSNSIVSSTFRSARNSCGIRKEDRGDAECSLAGAYAPTRRKKETESSRPQSEIFNEQPATCFGTHGESFYGASGRNKNACPTKKKFSAAGSVRLAVATRVQEGKTRIFQCGTREGKKKRGRRDEQQQQRQQQQREEKEQKGGGGGEGGGVEEEEENSLAALCHVVFVELSSPERGEAFAFLPGKKDRAGTALRVVPRSQDKLRSGISTTCPIKAKVGEEPTGPRLFSSSELGTAKWKCPKPETATWTKKSRTGRKKKEFNKSCRRNKKNVKSTDTHRGDLEASKEGRGYLIGDEQTEPDKETEFERNWGTTTGWSTLAARMDRECICIRGYHLDLPVDPFCLRSSSHSSLSFTSVRGIEVSSYRRILRIL